MTPQEALLDAQKRAAEAQSVTAEEVRALPWPDGCFDDEVDVSSLVWFWKADYATFFALADAAAIWFRHRAEACATQRQKLRENSRDVICHMPFGPPDEKLNERLDCIQEAMHDAGVGWAHWLSCADAWESLVRRIHP